MDNNIDNFKISTNIASAHVYDNRMKDVMDSVFVPGLAPFSVSQNQMNRLVLGSDPNDLLIVHNAGTGQETQLTLKTDGNAEIKSQMNVKVIGKDIELKRFQFHHPQCTANECKLVDRQLHHDW